MDSADSPPDVLWTTLDQLASVPLWKWIVGLGVTGVGAALLILALLVLFTPSPRLARKSEKQFISVLPDGSVSPRQPLPCWYDEHLARKSLAAKGSLSREEAYEMDAGECFMSVVVPAYNEEHRLNGMLDEAVEYLEENYGAAVEKKKKQGSNGSATAAGKKAPETPRSGWEILIVSDGSTDRTVETALQFARRYQNGKGKVSGDLPHGAMRIVQLEENRGKGGAVTHGMRHARGAYVVFADADGASRFTDLGKLVAGCERVKDGLGRAVGVGSRAHMVGTEAVVKRSLLRNTLMRAFHLLIRTLTPSKTGRIKDTQCGFKLFTRPSLPYIIPFMHSEGWIFDVEMLMLAESAEIPMVEVPIGWKEVMGSKLNVIKDSLGMAIGLAVLRVGWGTGIYRRD